MKVVIGRGSGFSLSRAAAERLRDEGHPLAIKEFAERAEWAKTDDSYLPGGHMDEHRLYMISRDDPALVRVVEEMGEAAWGDSSELKVIEIPDGIEWDVYESESGPEWVAEKHRTWR